MDFLADGGEPALCYFPQIVDDLQAEPGCIVCHCLKFKETLVYLLGRDGVIKTALRGIVVIDMNLDDIVLEISDEAVNLLGESLYDLVKLVVGALVKAELMFPIAGGHVGAS